MNGHIHLGAVAVIGTLATVYAANFLLRAWAGSHPDNVIAQAVTHFV